MTKLTGFRIFFFMSPQLVTYVAGRKYKQEKKVIKRIQQDEIQRGHSCSWTEAMQIPPLPPSHLKGCKLITTQYFLQVKASDTYSIISQKILM